MPLICEGLLVKADTVPVSHAADTMIWGRLDNNYFFGLAVAEDMVQELKFDKEYFLELA